MIVYLNFDNTYTRKLEFLYWNIGSININEENKLEALILITPNVFKLIKAACGFSYSYIIKKGFND